MKTRIAHNRVTKPTIAVLTLVLLGVAPLIKPTTDDVEDVKREFHAHVAALQSGDIEGYLRRHHPQTSTFEEDGGVLRVFSSRDEQRAGARAAIDSGAFANIQVRDLHATVYGGDAAVLTFYLVVSTPTPAGTPPRVWLRRSELWVKENGQWMEVHGHGSML